MRKRIAVFLLSFIALFSFAACQGGGSGTGSDSDGGSMSSEFSESQSSVPEKTEEELMAENELFADAISASESFVHNGITFRVTSVFVTFSPNDDTPTKTIKVYVDYPYEIKTVAYDDFSVIDPAGETYLSLLPDGLDYMGQYREEGKDGRATFIVPSKFDNYLLKVQMPDNEPVYVHFNLNDY